MGYTLRLNKGIGLATWDNKVDTRDVDDLKRYCTQQLEMLDVYGIYVFDDHGVYIGEMKRGIKTEWKSSK